MINKIDSIIAYIVLKKLITPITQSKAYKLKLINASGRVTKEPTTREEKEALTLLDKIVFKLKRLLGSKLQELNPFLYLYNSPDMYNKLIVNGDIKNRAEIKRIEKDIKSLQENYHISKEDILAILVD
jgi:hypothetical protein